MKTIISLIVSATAFFAAAQTDIPSPEAVSSKDAVAKQGAAAVAKGVKWLAENQKEDGSFSNPQFPALTGLAIWAMAGSGDPQYALNIEKGVKFLLGCAQQDGGIYTPIPGRKGGGLATYNTSICLIALHSTGRDGLEPVMLGARTYLAESQEMNDPEYRGGFGYDRDNDRAYADMMNTHFVLDAMRRTQALEDLRPDGSKRADIAWDAALDFVLKMQNDASSGTNNAGGFFYAPDDAKAGNETIGSGENERVVLRSYGSITYAGLLSMLHSNLSKSDTRVASAIDWASKHWTLEENPGMGEQGLYFFYNIIARAMSASKLEEIPRASGADIKWREEVVVKVISLMQKDGSWINKNGRFWENDPVLSTAYSVIALEFASGMAE